MAKPFKCSPDCEHDGTCYLCNRNMELPADMLHEYDICAKCARK